MNNIEKILEMPTICIKENEFKKIPSSNLDEHSEEFPSNEEDSLNYYE